MMGLCSLARAESPEAEARRHFIAGTKEYQLGEFKKAADEYKAAFRAKSDPVLLYNIAQALRLAGELQQALFFYQSYLRSVPNAHNKAEIDERIAKLQEQLKTNEAPPNTTLSPDGKPVASPPTASTPEPTTATDPDPAKPTVSEPAPSTTVVAAPKPVRQPVYKKWWLWTSVGVVVVGVGLGVGLGLGLKADPPSSHFGTTPLF
jgi:tetratricopeptide (TPR) repeat protein